MKKTHYLLACCLILFLNHSFKAQTKTKNNSKTKIALKTSPKKKETYYKKWSVKVGGNLNAIFLSFDTKEQKNKPGICAGLSYKINNFVRVSSLYSHFNPINTEPTRVNVKANTYEMNLEIMTYFPNKKTLVYPFAGISFNTSKSTFTGVNDNLNLKNSYTINSTIQNQWVGLNVGAGIEHNFGIIGLFVDYRMRFGKQEKVFNILEVCYTAGIKLRIPSKEGEGTAYYQNPRYLD